VKLQKCVEVESNFWVTHLMLGKVYGQERRFAEAISELEKARDLSHGNSEAIGSMGYLAGVTNDKLQAQRLLEQLQQTPSRPYVPPYCIALIYTGLGQHEDALNELGRACDDRDVRVTLLGVDPRWNSIRTEPRFREILKRIGLGDK
jgi:tetratricopeptide (TPR) repeat protein